MRNKFRGPGAAWAILAGSLLAASAQAQTFIGISPKASPTEAFAAREVERYVYLRTGRLLPIRAKETGKGIIVVRKDHLSTSANPDARALQRQQYMLASLGSKRMLIAGGDDIGVLYGAYRFAEQLGVRFYLHGDTIPDGRIPLRLPRLHEIGKPLFALRGINPFHDFPEGPDSWNRDDYLAYIGQLAKLRMNFIGLHTYPEGGVGPEPEVWIGQKQDIDARGHVRFSYPSQWANTRRSVAWGYDAAKTSQFSCGAGQFFASDDYGPDVMAGMMPRPSSPAGNNLLFNRAGDVFRDVFAEARSLGVKTCVGTETQLTIPKLVQDRLRAEGKDPSSPEVVQSVYAGMFSRIARLYPVDYYWLWTPEDWTWSGNSPEQLKKTTDDLHAALTALESIGNPFRLATAGWVLGPQGDRAALDRRLPKSVPLSAINQNVGNAPLDPAFGTISGRSKWAIPWMENDPTLTAPELWVGRMLYDAADAKRMGCDGLFGLNWRTKAMAPNVAALASAAWDESWKPTGFDSAAERLTSNRLGATGAEGGNMAQFTEPVAGTDEQPVYQSVRYDMSGYDVAVPNGRYTVTLKFNEPVYTEAGKRVFGVKLQGQTVIDRLDMYAKAGRNHAIDFTFDGIAVTDGHLKIDLVKEVEFPCIAGIVVAGPGFARKINCGGNRYQDYIGELDARPNPDPERRTAPTEWFYEDFARANFGDSVASTAGAIFSKIDGMNLPRPVTWISGPGSIVANPATWAQVAKSYGFVDEFAGLRSRVKGASNLERFDYWLNTFRYLRELGHLGCLRGRLDALMKQGSSAEQALAIRIELARAWERMMGWLEGTVSTPGELGTVCNIEQHSRLHDHFLDAHDDELAKALGRPLPRSVQLSTDYRGPDRIVVPTVRTSVRPGEQLTLNVFLVSEMESASGTLYWRLLGKGRFHAIPLRHIDRHAYRITLPTFPGKFGAIEYYIVARFGSGATSKAVAFPATAPEINQTIVESAAAGG